MKEKIQAFTCNKCGTTAYTTDGSRPGCCTNKCSARTSGICGGHFVASESSVDIDWIVNQEVERRIADVKITLREIKKASQNIKSSSHDWEADKIGERRGFVDGAKWAITIFRSRLTNPGDSQKTEGGKG